MYVQNGYDGDAETVNVLARHTIIIFQILLYIIYTLRLTRHLSVIVEDESLAYWYYGHA